jgi:hypothetical protein
MRGETIPVGGGEADGRALGPFGWPIPSDPSGTVRTRSNPRAAFPDQGHVSALRRKPPGAERPTVLPLRSRVRACRKALRTAPRARARVMLVQTSGRMLRRGAEGVGGRKAVGLKFNCHGPRTRGTQLRQDSSGHAIDKQISLLVRDDHRRAPTGWLACVGHDSSCLRDAQ